MTAQPTTPRVDTHHLAVPGARIYYEVRGSGELLLVIGQPMTSGPFAPLADLLAQHRTVVTYDPRGVGQSTVEDPRALVTPEDEADDLAAIIEAVGGATADVFGSSGGAVAGLALVSRRPELVRTLVAHEPPLTELLPDASAIRAVVKDIQTSFREAGAGAAWGTFVGLVMHQGEIGEGGVAPVAWPPQDVPGGDADADSAQDADAQDAGSGQDASSAPDDSSGDDAAATPSGPASPEQQSDEEVFFLHMLEPFTRWMVPDVALDDVRERVVVAIGEASHGEVAARATRALAERLGVSVTPFPGDHGGFMADPAAFADALRVVLGRPA